MCRVVKLRVPRRDIAYANLQHQFFVVVPVPSQWSQGCRYDVLLKADQPPRTYYITSNTQYRSGSPNGYGFLRYAGTNTSQLPPTPTPQPDGVKPWNGTVAGKVRSADPFFSWLESPELLVLHMIHTSCPNLGS